MQIKNKYVKALLFAVLFLLFLMPGLRPALRVDAAAKPGCYKVVNGKLEKQTSCPTKNVQYDNGKGASLSPPPDPTKCFVYSPNLFDGDTSFGEPYVLVPCDNLSACPAGQELRYNDNKLGAPKCVASSTATSGSFAGGASSPTTDGLPVANTGDIDGKYICGKGEDNEVKVSFNFGCIGQDYSGPTLNPIIDMAFAIFRFLSAGVGLIVIGSIIVAGIQYTASRGNPQATEASIKRVTNSVIALLIYMFIFAIANFLVPGGMFIS